MNDEFKVHRDLAISINIDLDNISDCTITIHEINDETKLKKTIVGGEVFEVLSCLL